MRIPDPTTLGASSPPPEATTPAGTAAADVHMPFTLVQPVTVTAGLCLNNTSAPCPPPQDEQGLLAMTQRWTVCLQLDQTVINRLFCLWNALHTLAADEIADWALAVRCAITSADDVPVPSLLCVSATVYANGDVSFAVTLEGVDPALWLVEGIDLNEFECVTGLAPISAGVPA
ncbi:hypothetical protein RA210_U10409 [Rubrivivax sp. A210]|uniref:hypothetical protein n=1 Tax=Rubrivivax sp. A210 TaxID=2772301 RepID=UPI001919DE44|nr:hypothetical protein [Rubrivivax sp. A210]CAD5366606.1 hypothetical protein RA210_U10409 [Rubrivivax sp. A210]